MRALCCFCVLGILSAQAAFAADLSLSAGDLHLTQGADGGYHFFIRKKPDIGSIMLCETTSDPAMREPTYAYRALEANSINGDEKRMLDGRFIGEGRKNLFLMTSKVEYVAEWRAEFFHVYIPYIILYGYPDVRHGEVYVGTGTFLNIRAFAQPYGDYSGGFKDNPFELEPVQNPLEGPPEANYMKDALDALTQLSERGGGKLEKAGGELEIVPAIRQIIRGSKTDSIDLAIVLDTTNSMKNDIEQIKKDLPPLIEEIMNEQKKLRIGFVFFRDYREQFITRPVEFSSDVKKIQTTLSSVRAAGGGDIPEAIHEAIYDAAIKLDWYGKERFIVLVTDAPPHLRPRGKIKASDALEVAALKKIVINTVLLPQ